MGEGASCEAEAGAGWAGIVAEKTNKNRQFPRARARELRELIVSAVRWAAALATAAWRSRAAAEPPLGGAEWR